MMTIRQLKSKQVDRTESRENERKQTRADMDSGMPGKKEAVKARNENIASAAYKRLEKHPHFRRHRLDVQLSCERSVLILAGRLPSYYLKQVLQTVLRDLDGVSQIENDVEVMELNEPQSISLLPTVKERNDV